MTDHETHPADIFPDGDPAWADHGGGLAHDERPRACTDHLVIDCPDCPADQLGPGTATALICPDCDSSDFELRLGGRDSGQIRCTGCGLRFEPIRDDGES